ncbi:MULTISPECIES: DUF4936 family protein [unclassified Rubrivivax]|uniref:DUF4936 family protein n=1 Tax=unclassified Rubrivivax TaxID=2649762 RepID=UPI001E5274B8|nr:MULTISPECIES: DUF4936 family protein [unclassified Rubrivivax]MCC9597437.1 DUF4936 family protein [Rubrivivax sp. JA1055]MCC9646305.1 DUF4936 family protein [Rubrivivax sp. JA1029]MCD0416605.1 DUF4936 family protein [Rubrivivax sp. JA1024]
MAAPARRYVYYRVAERDVEACAVAARAAFAALPFAVELLRRPEVRDGLATLMEVHGAADEREADTAEAHLAAALAPWIVGERHVERFVPLA